MIIGNLLKFWSFILVSVTGLFLLIRNRFLVSENRELKHQVEESEKTATINDNIVNDLIETIGEDEGDNRSVTIKRMHKNKL
jgi:hypothetical protein